MNSKRTIIVDKMNKLRIFYLSLSIFFCISIDANVNLNLPTKVLGGESFFFYKVNGKESLEDIAKKIGVTVNDIIQYNPSASQGVANKQLLFFPVADFSTPDNQNTTNIITTKNVTHLVKKGQSLYGISKLYNITIDELVAANPHTNDGLKEGQVIVIPTGKATTQGNAISSVLYHTILKGESMYSVAKQYNTTIENLLALNPGIYPNNFIEGDVVKVIPNTSTTITVQKEIKQMVSYVVKKDDTFESIALANNITVEHLRTANPELKKLKKGNIIYIPKDGITSEIINSSQASEKQLEQTYSKKIDDIFSNIHKKKHRAVLNIAMVLPFQLHKENPPRQAYLYTDFYKGFLLAVDSIGKNINKKVNLNVYDTQHNLNVTDSILGLPIMQDMDVIIAPSEPKQLERINNFGLKNNIYVINCFSSKNEDYASNPKIIQLNMPTSYLAASVNELISEKFNDYEVIFLKDSGSEDTEILPEIKQYLKSHKIKSHIIDVINPIEFETVSSFMDPGSNYLFIPTTSSKQFFNKFSNALKDVKQKRFDCEVRLLGHPEYLSMKEIKNSMQTIDSYVYSRFFIANAKRGENVQAKFKATYNENMIATTPSLGILGFDLGSYIITTISSGNSFDTPKLYFDGVEMDIELERSSNWGGYINKCVEIVHFTNTGVSESVIK